MRTVCYLISGRSHLPYLATSLLTLRRWWSDRVVIYAWPESYETAQRIGSDLEINAGVVRIEPERRCRLIGGQPFDRIRIMQDDSNKTAGVYLDCDTLVANFNDDLFILCEDRGFTFTQFCDWVTTGHRISKRIARLVGIEGIDQDAVQYALSCPLPSVNTGIFACRPHSPILDRWHAAVTAAVGLFIGDEISAHAIMAADMLEMMPHLNMHPLLNVWYGGAWNCSPNFQPKHLPDDKVFIWHGHGDCFTRPSKSPKGVELWWPVYEECLKKNIGGIWDWKDAVGHKFLPALEVEMGNK